MNLADITTKCYILALIIRDDGERLLLGDGAYEFKDSQQHFIANTYANDVVELQGTDGQMLAGQVRRTATQTFAGYIGDATFSKQKIEQARRDFLMFFRKKHYYTAVYVFSDGTAIQRDRGYIVNAPSVPELYQRFPEWSVGLNFEDPNYYEYAEDDLGQEIAAHKVELELSTAMSGGLIWDGDGAVSDDLSYVGTEIQGEGKNFQLADTGTATLKSASLLGDATQTTYTGKNLFNINATPTYYNASSSISGQTITVTTNANAQTGRAQFPITYEANRQMTISFDAKVVQNDVGSSLVSVVCMRTPGSSDTVGSISLNNTVGQTNHYQGTFTPDNNTRYLWLYTKSVGIAGVVKVEYSNIQIEYSSSETSYEPYVGGTASPNPDYPQGVSTATGEQTVKIEGKNMFNQGHYGTGHTAGGITADFASDAITMSGTSTSGAWPSFTMYADGSFLQQSWWPTTTAIDTSKGAFNDAGDYRFTIWIDGNRGTAAANFRYIIGYMDGTVTNAYFPLDDASYSFTITKPINFISVGTANNVTVNCSVRIQLEKGTSGSSFEPYQAQTRPVNLTSKNIANPQTFIDWITTTNNLCVQYSWQTDASRPAYGEFQGRSHVARFNADTLYTVRSQMTNPTYDEARQIYANNGKFKENTRYTISMDFFSSSGNPNLQILYTDGSYSPIAPVSANAWTHSVTTSLANKTIKAIRMNYQSGVTYVDLDTLQIEEGTSASAYEAYWSIELVKIGNYQDKIYKENGKWYLHKAVRHISLPIASMDNNDNYPGWKSTPGIRADLGTGQNGQLIEITDFTSNVREGSFGIGINTNGSNQILFFNTSLVFNNKTQTQIKADYPNLVVELYYGILEANQTDEEITNSELVGQLERLRHAHTYADLTNFSITATSPNLPAFLKVVAFGDDAIPQGGYVWEDGGAGGATTITVDGVDNAQPIWTVVGPATNPSLTNITTGESIQWTGVVPNGQTLVVNMADMTASLSGANVFEFISGSWITLQAGNNRVSYSATAATGIATLEWNGVVG